MRIVLLLVAAAVTVALPAAADEPEAGATPSGPGAALAPSNSHTLAQIHGVLTADGSRLAGRSRDIQMSAAQAGGAANVVRPAPTPRVLRRMTPERVVLSIEPAVHACASESATAASTSFGLRVSVAPSGEVEGAEPASTVRLAPALLACVVQAVSAAHFGAPGAAGASIVLPITVPGRAVVSAPAATTTVTMTPPASALSPPAAKPAEAVASKQ